MVFPFAIVADIFAFAFSESAACSRAGEASLLCMHYWLSLHCTGDTGETGDTSKRHELSSQKVFAFVVGPNLNCVHRRDITGSYSIGSNSKEVKYVIK